jgi:hypothetical protein
MTCRGFHEMTHQTHVSPINARGHWRTYSDGFAPCTQPAEVHVHVQYAGDLVVESDLCRACAEAWQNRVARLHNRRAVWTITPLDT